MRRASSPGSYGRAPARSLPGPSAMVGWSPDAAVEPAQRRSSSSRRSTGARGGDVGDAAAPGRWAAVIRRPASASVEPAVCGVATCPAAGEMRGAGTVPSTRRDHVVGVHALGQRVVGEHDAVPQHLGRHVEHVLRDDEAAAAQHGEGPGRGRSGRGCRAGWRRARCSRPRSARPQRAGLAGGHDEAHGVVLHGVVDEDVVGRRPAARRAARASAPARPAAVPALMRWAIATSSSYVGCGTTTCMRNRSRCASGRA